MLADAGAIFIGQGVGYGGVASYTALDGVPVGQRIELPVAEELQMGIGIGLAIQGSLVVSVYPRIDFLLRALDQLVNHLDKLEAMSGRQFRPRIIVRTRVGSRKPLDAGPQHSQDHTEALRMMLTNVDVVRLTEDQDAISVYKSALDSERSTLVVENIRC